MSDRVFEQTPILDLGLCIVVMKRVRPCDGDVLGPLDVVGGQMMGFCPLVELDDLVAHMRDRGGITVATARTAQDQEDILRQAVRSGYEPCWLGVNAEPPRVIKWPGVFWFGPARLRSADA